MRDLREIQRAAKDAGLLPPDAVISEQESRPWPVLLLTAIGAWLAAVPLIAVVGMMLGPVIQSGIGPYFIGILLIAGAVVLLHSRGLPVFVEQLSLPALLVGAGSLSFGLQRDLPTRGATFVLMAISLTVAWFIPRAWLRNLLGVAAAALAVITMTPPDMWHSSHLPLFMTWVGLHASLAVWIGATLWQRELANAQGARTAAFIESIGSGWVLALLAGLAWWSGMTFLVAGTVGGLAADIAREMTTYRDPVGWIMRAGSVAFAIGAMLVVARSWMSLRTPLPAAVAIVLVVLAGFMPSLGGVLFVLAVAAASHRFGIAAAAAVAAAWIVGAFYYQLQWPLAMKGGVLFGAGVVLGAIAWLARERSAKPASKEWSLERRGAAFAALAAVATLAVANFSIWQKEDLIANGQRVFVRLAPVDPRSLMQGDFMRLNFTVPRDLESVGDMVLVERPYVVAKRDERGVAQLVRIYGIDKPLANDEMRIELTPKDGRWILVSDAWFFREGDAKRWQDARYGEFRVLPDGRALLVGLADEQLRPIRQ